MRLFIVICFVLGATLCVGDQVQVKFQAPDGWRLAEDDRLPKSVRVMVVGTGKKSFPPSLNLTTEIYPGTQRDYLKLIKAKNAEQGREWKDLGSIQTKAGEASLSQAIQKTSWGNVQMMHVILVKNGMVYNLTASALQEEFTLYYPEFIAAFKSLQFDTQ